VQDGLHRHPVLSAAQAGVGGSDAAGSSDAGGIGWPGGTGRAGGTGGTSGNRKQRVWLANDGKRPAAAVPVPLVAVPAPARRVGGADGSGGDVTLAAVAMEQDIGGAGLCSKLSVA
jgi:hypothetical protein